MRWCSFRCAGADVALRGLGQAIILVLGSSERHLAPAATKATKAPSWGQASKGPAKDEPRSSITVLTRDRALRRVRNACAERGTAMTLVRTRAQWAARIRAAHTHTVRAILKLGRAA